MTRGTWPEQKAQLTVLLGISLSDFAKGLPSLLTSGVRISAEEQGIVPPAFEARSLTDCLRASISQRNSSRICANASIEKSALVLICSSKTLIELTIEVTCVVTIELSLVLLAIAVLISPRIASSRYRDSCCDVLSMDAI